MVEKIFLAKESMRDMHFLPIMYHSKEEGIDIKWRREGRRKITVKYCILQIVPGMSGCEHY